MLSISRLPLRLRLLVPIMTLSVIIFSVMTLFSAKKARDLVSAEAEIRLGEESNAASSEQIASTAEEIRNQARVMNFATSELRVVVYGGEMPTQAVGNTSNHEATSEEEFQAAE